jgi:hypothetical protein
MRHAPQKRDPDPDDYQCQVDVDHDLAFCRSVIDRRMCCADTGQVEAARIEARAQLAGFNQDGSLAQDLAMMGAAFA